MLISQLPEDIKAKVIAYSKDKRYNGNPYTDNIAEAFFWDYTPEGSKYWRELHESKLVTQNDNYPIY